MNTKTKSRLLLVGSAALVATSALLSMNGMTLIPVHQGLSVHCVSTFSLPELPAGGKYDGSLMVQLLKNNTGVIEFAGIVTTEPKADNRPGLRLILQRSVSFNYQNGGNGTVFLKDLKLSKHSLDNMPDEMFIRNIYDPYTPEKRAQISSINNAYLLGNAFSPTNICVSQSE
ncbi:hypothetical protein HV169_19310 [Citrobacter freundii]|jgi:hypothetical protein|uniref:hypothetical protein n=1 Tax=Citrobacter gillenii TaxID=67828 RepID=UPI00109386E9|nr:hypothetical protein [Citrobacter freundii]MBA7731218.1 hypothetical protein [Citrobacter freundii]QCA17375.1 hypothetical protein E5284_05580 [Citrobacter freundii]